MLFHLTEDAFLYQIIKTLQTYAFLKARSFFKLTSTQNSTNAGVLYSTIAYCSYFRVTSHAFTDTHIVNYQIHLKNGYFQLLYSLPVYLTDPD